LQYPIERARVGDKARPIGRLDQLLDQRIDDLVLDAEARSGFPARLRDRPENCRASSFPGDCDAPNETTATS